MQRITSVDAYRGFVMFLMLAEVMHLSDVAKEFPNNRTLQLIGVHTSHVKWVGCSLHDMIQPSFSFLVGVALTFSLARRKEQALGWVIAHAVWRSLVLIWLGVFLRSLNTPRTNFTFEDTLSQIGLGYVPLVILARFKPRVWLITLVSILVGYWLLFALWPLPPEDFDRTTVGVKADWPNDATGLAAHWNLNRNPAAEFDALFLKTLRGDTDETYKYNSGGYTTLNFIPTLATMILGLFAGRILQSGDPLRQVGIFFGVAIGLLLAGFLLGYFGICPVVKRIWTPSWVLVSGGLCFMMLATFHTFADVTGYGGWSYPLRVIGANSILIYVIADMHIGNFIQDSFRKHFGSGVFKIFGEKVEPVVAGAAVLVVYWLGLWWLYVRKVLVRI